MLQTETETYVPNPQPTKTASIIRNYAAGVAAGHFDADLTARQARLCAALLTHASNHGTAGVNYNALATSDRDILARQVGNLTWDARWLVESTVADGAARNHLRDDLDAATERAIAILRGI